MESLDVLLVGWWFLLLCLMVYIPTELHRRAFDMIWPHLKDNKYRHYAFTFLPVPGGVGLALGIRDYPFLADQGSEAVRVGFGMAAGFLCTWAVKVLKHKLKAATGVDVDEEK